MMNAHIWHGKVPEGGDGMLDFVEDISWSAQMIRTCWKSLQVHVKNNWKDYSFTLLAKGFELVTNIETENPSYVGCSAWSGSLAGGGWKVQAKAALNTD